jgi:hypothetical protein
LLYFFILVVGATYPGWASMIVPLRLFAKGCEIFRPLPDIKVQICIARDKKETSNANVYKMMDNGDAGE